MPLQHVRGVGSCATATAVCIEGALFAVLAGAHPVAARGAGSAPAAASPSSGRMQDHVSGLAPARGLQQSGSSSSSLICQYKINAPGVQQWAYAGGGPIPGHGAYATSDGGWFTSWHG